MNVKYTRRWTKELPSSNDLLRQIRNEHRRVLNACLPDEKEELQSQYLPDLDNLQTAVHLLKGVFINGRKYAFGDHVEYLPSVNRRLRESQEHGSSQSYRVGTINRFYQFKTLTGSTCLFVELTNRPVIEIIRFTSTDLQI